MEASEKLLACCGLYCDDFKACDKLKPMEALHGDACRKNLQAIRAMASRPGWAAASGCGSGTFQEGRKKVRMDVKDIVRSQYAATILAETVRKDHV